MSETIRLKWKEKYEEFIKDPVKVYRRKIERSKRLIERYKELIEKHQKKIKRLEALIELVESGAIKFDVDPEEASKEYIARIYGFLGLKGGETDA